jgi:succinoglycan biosynthesis transport protein ExoP
MQAIKEIISLPGRAMNNVISALQTYFRRTKTVAQDMEGLEPAPASFEEQRRQHAIAQLQGSLIVKPRKGTELVDIIIKGSNPEDTAEKVNKVAEIYARQNLEDRLDASRKAIDWLKRESKEIKERIDNVEASLKDFREKNNFILQDDLRYIKDPMIDKLNTLQSSYIQTDITKEDLKIQIEEVKNLLKNRNLEEIVGIMPSSISNNNSIRSLMDRYIVLKTEYYNLSEKFKENNPRLIRLKSESDRIKDSIYVEIEKLIQSKQMEYNNIIEREKYAEKLIHRQRIKVVDIGNKFENYNALKTAIAIDKDLYNALSKRLAETVLTEALESNNIKVVRLAPIPNYPLPSGNEKKIMLSVVVALAFGAGLAVFMDSQDKRF